MATPKLEELKQEALKLKAKVTLSLHQRHVKREDVSALHTALELAVENFSKMKIEV
jgi:hypothetical protein